MRYAATILFIGWAAVAHADVSPPSSSSSVGNSVSSVLLARLGGIQPFGAGSATVTTKNFLDASASMHANTIYYSALTLNTNPPPPTLPLDTTGAGSTNDLDGFTKSGDNGVLNGGGASGSGQTGNDGGTPQAPVPTPGAATLSLIGMVLVLRRRQRRPSST